MQEPTHEKESNGAQKTEENVSNEETEENNQLTIDQDEKKMTDSFNNEAEKDEAAPSTEEESIDLGRVDVPVPVDMEDNEDEQNGQNVEPFREVRIRGWVQFFALMRKNIILKKRTPALTFFEMFCPVAMVWILTAAFNATGVTEVSSMDYSSFRSEVPGALMFYLIQTGVIPAPPEIWSGKIDPGSSFAVGDDRKLESSQNIRNLQETIKPETKPANSREAELQASTVNRRNLDTMLASPLPVPSLNQYVQMHKLFERGFEDTVSTDLKEFQDTADFSMQWGNLLGLGTVHVVGDEISNDFVNYVQKEYSNVTDEFSFVTWTEPQEALDYIETFSTVESTWAIIDFTNGNVTGSLSEMGNDIEYTIRMNSTTVPWTRFQITSNAVGYDNIYQMYYFSGYLTWQKTINDFFLSRNDNCAVPGDFDVWTSPMPTAAFSQNEFFLAVGFLLSMALAMAFLFPVSRLIKSIVEEKENRMKQTLLTLGVRPWAHWLSWTIFNILFFMILSALVTALLSAQIAQNSNRLILYGFILTFSLSILSFSFFVASFFSRAKLASILGPLLFFGTLLPRYIFLGTRQEESLVEKKWASLAPCTAFAFGAELLADLEYAEQGFQWWNIRSGGFDVAMSFNLMLLDAILYMFLGWYLEQVFPSQFGVQKKWYFLLTPTYWKRLFGYDVDEHDDEIEEQIHEVDENYIQNIDNSLTPQVRIENLVKIYKKGQTPAVNNLNLSLYEDRITCLLGHNGAGKSTTMSVLTGLYPPTKGDCFVYNKSIRKELDKLRESMGICPQHNVIFDDLSVYEHIRLFETIKGVKPTKESIMEKAKEVDLHEKLHSYAKTLSGGQKRKLCVAMALCGEPRFVLLDEPTSGMDPFTRRATWELLRKKKKGRVTLLTTHFMEEAELLADHIAVLSTGKLQAYGTNLFLKNQFGLGYNLTVVIDEHSQANNNPEIDLDERVDNIIAFLEGYIPRVELLRRSVRELIFRFPPGSEDQFPRLFEELERAGGNVRKSLGIGGYGVSNTTLEAVFLRLAEEQEQRDQEMLSQHERSIRILQEQPDEQELRPVGRLEQIGILLQKRWTIQKRDKKGFVFQIVLPVIAVAIALVFLTLDFVASQPPMEVSADLYHKARRVQETNLLIGGSTSDIEDIASLMESTIEEEYDNVFVDFVPNISNSSQMSEYLLETYHDTNHFWRYQAYLFNDTINITVIQDWDDIRFILENGDPSQIGDAGLFTVDLQDRPVYDDDFDLIEVADFVYSRTPLLPESPVDITSLVDRLHDLFSFSTGPIHQIIDALTADFREVTNMEELFSAINVRTGGSSEQLDATYRLTFDSITFDLVKETIEINDVSFIFEDLDTRLQAEQAYMEYDEGFQITLFQVRWEGRIINDEVTVPIPGADELERLLESIFQMDLTVGDPTEYSSVFEYISTLLPTEPNTTSTFVVNNDVTVMFNTSSFHAVAAGYQGYIEYLYKTCTSNPKARFVSINHPLPLTEQKNLELKAQLSVFASLFTLIPFCYAPAAFIIFIVKERSSKSKHLQLVSGVDMLAFWVATYIWDIFMWVIFTLLNMAVFSIYGRNSAEVFVGDAESFLCTLALTFGYGLSALPFAYLLSRNFESHTTAQISILGLFFVTGFIAVLTYFILKSFEEFQDLAEHLRVLFRFWPAYNVGDGLINLSQNFFMREVLGVDKSPFDWDVCGIHVALLYLESIPYFLLVIFMEYSGDGGSGGFIGRFLRFVRTTTDRTKLAFYGVGTKYQFVDETEMDPDVKLENETVANQKNLLKDEASVLLVNLWKIFPPPISLVGRFVGLFRKLWNCLLQRNSEEVDSSKKPKTAVRGLSTAVKRGDTFGLLGVNGAGKTTTMAVLTGDISLTNGEAYVAGFDVTGNTSGGVIEARKRIGFCPQIDPLLDLMTARETLTMFGRLRGVPRDALEQTVNDLIDALTLTPHADKASGKYSGGNKRKLSLGIAIIGNPKVLFIDEASSGMDPVARRKMWELISLIGEQRSVVLTTHSMEEAEALCSRIGIMIAGQMRTIGSVQHLKSKHLDGYTVDMQIEPEAPNHVIEHVKQLIPTDIFPGSKLKEAHGGFLRFHINGISEGASESDTGLGYMFRKLQAMKTNSNLRIENYSISQATLEQVFIKLVREEHGEDSHFIEMDDE